MRDGNRIKPIMTELEKIWVNNPDWRFGQLISNVFGQIMYDEKISDMFFPEDSVWLKGLQKYNEGHSALNHGQDLLKDK